MKDMMSFGHEVLDPITHKNRQRIGMFGVGFKTGTMALGKDALVFTIHTQSRTRSVGFLSRSYNEGESRQKLHVPIVSWKDDGTYDTDKMPVEQAELNEGIIVRWTPLNSQQIGTVFGSMDSHQHSTRIYVFNLHKIAVNGEDVMQLKVNGDTKDIELENLNSRKSRIRNRGGDIKPKEVPADWSLRAYLEILFLSSKSNMNVSLQDGRITPKYFEKLMAPDTMRTYALTTDDLAILSEDLMDALIQSASKAPKVCARVPCESRVCTKK
jgi:hypothetical protein